MNPRGLAAAALLALVTVLCGCGGALGDSTHGDRERPRDDPRPERVSPAKAAQLPNVIFIYTDDQNLREFKPRYMPRTFRRFVRPGTLFKDYVVATPLCCPSRATYMTGNYPHNDGVFSNRGGYSNLKEKYNTLPVWMRNAGYRTAWIGKYLQGWEQAVDNIYKAPPGIDDFHATFDPDYYDFTMADNGRKVVYGDRSRDYYTTVITRLATGLIKRQSERRRPLFMTINNLAPHHGSGKGGRCTDLAPPAPRDVDRYRHARVPRTPAWNERDISDKRGIVPDKRLSKAKIGRLDLAYGCRLATLRAVDRSNAAIFRAVRKAGELSNTVFFFSSDNGILQGEHRIGGKNVPYEEGLHQPLAIRAGRKALDGRTAVPRIERLASNIDFAPTILDFADARPCARPGNCRKLDGRSLVPALAGRSAEEIPADREILVEGGTGGGDCAYAGIRTPDLNYTEWARERPDGTCERDFATELYDLTGRLGGEPDPHELDNLASPGVPGSGRPVVREQLRHLKQRLRVLRRCSGATCR